MNNYYVYILGNRKGTLTPASRVTVSVECMSTKTKAVTGFTARYKLDQLFIFEEFDNIYNALDAEKKINAGCERRNKR